MRKWYLVGLNFLIASFYSGFWLGYRAQTNHQSLNQSSWLVSPAPVPKKNSSSFELDPADSKKIIRYILVRDGSLAMVLKELGIPEPLLNESALKASEFYDLDWAQKGKALNLQRDPNGEFSELDLEINSWKRLVIKKQGSELVATIQRQKNQSGNLDSISANHWLYAGKIETSFWEAGMDAGMSPDLIMESANVFGWQGGFFRQMWKGDQFFILVEENQSGREKILAMELKVRGKPYYAYYYQEGKNSGYYDEKGYSWKGFNLIKPVPSARISSHYTQRRLHPIFNTYGPHLAVDYSAPAGTRVLASASGVITFAGWKNGYGNYIEIKHNSIYTTTYGHLQKFAKGIKKGLKVKQGQVIGYVGSTGIATGPHLDYRILKNEKSINPTKFQGAKTQTVKDTKQFKQIRAALDQEIAILKNQPPEIITTSIAAQP